MTDIYCSVNSIKIKVIMYLCTAAKIELTNITKTKNINYEGMYAFLDYSPGNTSTRVWISSGIWWLSSSKIQHVEFKTLVNELLRGSKKRNTGTK